MNDDGRNKVGSYISKIFGASPVAPIQDHMEICYKAAKELVRFFEYVNSDDWEKVRESREKIVRLENEADEAKKQIRMQLSQALFMPVARADLLDLVLVQDKIPNLARDVSGLVIGRQLAIPDVLQEQFLAFVSRNVDAAKGARKTIRELDELYETGFRGTEVDSEVNGVSSHVDPNPFLMVFPASTFDVDADNLASPTWKISSWRYTLPQRCRCSSPCAPLHRHVGCSLLVAVCLLAGQVSVGLGAPTTLRPAKASNCYQYRSPER